jgi:hypothetical protein
MGGAFLAGALEALSGDVAADERSEGPSCVLSAVDHRQDKRMRYAVRDHDPNHDDIEAFLGRLQTALDERHLTLKGSTTDSSALSPDPLRQVFSDVPHQLCPFHVSQALTQGRLQAVAQERERLAQSTPPLQRGRVSSKEKAARRSARQSTSIQQKISDVFQERFVFVKRHVIRSARKRCMHSPRGRPQCRTLRESMDHLSALCDRRCRTQTALGKRKTLRQWVKRVQWLGETFKTVCSPHLEKALTCLDDK